MKKKQISQILSEWSNEFDKDYHESYNKDLRSGDYRDLLSEVIDRIEALNNFTKRKWYQR